MTAPLLRVEHVRKSFGKVVALSDVSLEVAPAAVTCLLGDNGAGKSTLINILSGLFPPDAGRLLLNGSAVALRSPRHARSAGIATVHQNLALLPLLSVWRNFVLGAEPVRGRGPLRRIDRTRARQITRQGLDRLGVPLDDVDRPVGTLSGGQRQATAIARAIHFGARILILDEPTAALGVRQTRLVLDAVAAARDRGVAVVLITHNPRHAHPLGDRYVVLRQGAVVLDCPRAETSPDALSEWMAG